MGKKTANDYDTVLFTEFLLQLGCIYCIGDSLLKYKADGHEFFLACAISFAIFSASILLMSYGRQIGRFYLFWPYFICVAFKLLAFSLLASLSFIIVFIATFFPSKFKKEEWAGIYVKSLFSGVALLLIVYFLIQHGIITIVRLRKRLIHEQKMKRVIV